MNDFDTWMLDPYRTAAEQRLRQAIADTEPADVDRLHRDYEQRRASAQLQVRFADRVGEEVPDEIRRLAETPSKREWVDDLVAQRQQTQRDALAEAAKPIRGRHDGSQVETFSDDLTGQRMELERLLGGQSQVARHRAMSEAGYAHKDPRERFLADLAAREARQ